MPTFLISLEYRGSTADHPDPGYAQRLADLDNMDLDALEIYLDSDEDPEDPEALAEAIDEALSEYGVGLTHADFDYDVTALSEI